MNAVEVVFKEGSDKILQFGESAADSVGLANSEFNQLAAVTGALLRDVGKPMDEVAALTIKLTKRAADLASVFNTDVSDAMGAVNAAIRGETEAIRRFGGDVTDASLQQFNLAQGIDTAVSSMTQQEKRLLRIKVLFSQTEDVQDDFLNTQDSLANITRTLGSKFTDTAASIGILFVPALEAALGAVNDLFDTLELRIQDIQLTPEDLVFVDPDFAGAEGEVVAGDFMEGFRKEFQKIVGGSEFEQEFNTAFALSTGTLASDAKSAAEGAVNAFSEATAANPPKLPFIPVEEVELTTLAMAEQSEIMRNLADLTDEQLQNYIRSAEIMGEKIPDDLRDWLALQEAINSSADELPSNINVVSGNMEAAASAAGKFSQNLARSLISGKGLEKSLLSAAISLGLSFIPGGSLFGGLFAHGGTAPGGFVPSIVGEGGGAPEIVQSARPIRGTPLTNNNTTNTSSTIFNLSFSGFPADDFQLRKFANKLSNMVQNGEIHIAASEVV